MSAIVTGDYILSKLERRGIYDSTTDCYRFYNIYQSYVPTNDLAFIKSSNSDKDSSSPVGADLISCQVWIPLYSPEMGFPENSLIYLRGRLIILPSTDSVDSHHASTLTIYVECIHAIFRKCLPTPDWTPPLLIDAIRPEPSVVGRIKRTWSSESSSLYVLLEINEDVNDSIETMFM